MGFGLTLNGRWEIIKKTGEIIEKFLMVLERSLISFWLVNMQVCSRILKSYWKVTRPKVNPCRSPAEDNSYFCSQLLWFSWSESPLKQPSFLHVNCNRLFRNWKYKLQPDCDSFVCSIVRSDWNRTSKSTLPPSPCLCSRIFLCVYSKKSWTEDEIGSNLPVRSVSQTLLKGCFGSKGRNERKICVLIHCYFETCMGNLIFLKINKPTLDFPNRHIKTEIYKQI